MEEKIENEDEKNYTHKFLLEKIERFKLKSENFLKNNIKVFIIDINDQYYFSDILFVGDSYIIVRDFKGSRKYEKSRLLWVDIVRIEPYKNKEGEDYAKQEGVA